jgi:RimJ/RimL family protein N-acetyltransferase
MSIDIDLRRWTDEHLDLLRRCNTREMWKYLGGPESEEQMRRRHRRYLADDWRGGGGMFCAELLPEREPVGIVGYWERTWQDAPIFETGWHVLPEFQGRGIATAAVREVLARAGTEAGPRQVRAFPSVENVPSNAICRKVGFTLTGVVDFEYPPGNPMRCNDWRWDLDRDGEAS